MIEILLATYNGEKYLAEQIESIIKQTYTNWRLLVRDDNSTDKTLQILHLFAKQDKRIFIIEGHEQLGTTKNFMYLLSLSTSQYVMFCDQDDFWLSDKIEISLRKMKISEEMEPLKPILVCSDLMITDCNLKSIGSMWNSSVGNPTNSITIYDMLVNNYISGCTMLINRKAIQITKQIEDITTIHDLWIGLNVMFNNGIILPIKLPTILYRQHTLNAIGIEKHERNLVIKKIIDLRITIRTNINSMKTLKAISNDFSYKKYFQAKLKTILFKKRLHEKN